MGRKSKRPDGKPPTVAVKVERALATKAKLIAADKGVDLGSYISEAIRGTIDRDWSEMILTAKRKG